jgi:superkiller protein 3
MSIKRNAFISLALIFTFIFSAAMPFYGQDLVPVSSIGGASSVFVFRKAVAGAARRFTSTPHGVRTKSQRLETAKKIKKQYDTLAKVEPRRPRSTVVTPDKVPQSVATMPKAQASKIFAGVGEYYIDQNDTDQSIDFFRESLTLDAKNAKAVGGLSEALAAKGNEYLFAEQTSKAKAFFLESIKYNPQNAVAYFGLGEVYTDLDQSDQAIVSYEKALAGDAKLTEIYLPLGILYYQKGEIAKADGILTKAQANSIENSESDVLLGAIRSSQNRMPEALDALNRAQQLDPKNAEAFYYKGDILLRQGHQADAITEFQKAVALRPNYFEPLRASGQAYLELKKYPEAVAAYKMATRFKNDNAETYAGLGEAYRLTGNYNDAESAYATAKDLTMRNPAFIKDDVADLFSKIGYSIGRQCELNMRKAIACRWPSAIDAFKKAVDLAGSPLDNANLGWAYYNAARVDINMRQPDKARPNLELAKTALQKALSGSPQIADGVMQNLGGVLIDLGDFTGAIQQLKPVVDREPDWTFSKYALGTAYFKSGDFNNAARMFNAALDSDRDNVNYLSSLGYSQLKLRNAKEVRKVVDRLKKVDPAEARKLEQQALIAGVK